MTSSCPALQPAAPGASTGPRLLRSDELLAGGCAVVIRDGEETNRLKLTSTNKLILII